MDHRLGIVYRNGAGACGLLLLVFGLLRLPDGLAFFGTAGQRVAGLPSNSLLSSTSLVVCAALIAGAVNMMVGAVIVASGLANLALPDAKADFPAFRPQNVIFSFAVVLLRLTFGIYIRFRSKLPHDNPYWRALNPESAHEERTLTSAVGSAPAKLSRDLAGSVGRSR